MRNALLGDAIAAPVFGRLDDYFGVWLYQPDKFFALWDYVRRTDLPAHMSAHQAAAPAAPKPPGLVLEPGKGGKSIARIPIRGTLMKSASSFGGQSTVQMRRDIRQAAAEETVSGILLEIDSPGGTLAGTDDLASEVAAARRQKPVWAFIEDLGASAAYYVASQADMIFANSPTAVVGSIGTVQVVYDYSAAAEQEGVKVLRFATGPLKGAGWPGTAVTEDQAAYFQALVDEGQKSFDAAVRKGRGMSAAELAAVRTGGVFSAPEAKARKLIDGVQSLDRTLNALASAK